MGLWNALKSLLARDPVPVDHPPAPDTLHDLVGRVAALEDIQTRRELEWAETKQALDRMLKRAAALDQRAREREADPPRNGKRAATVAQLLQAKGYLPKGE